MVRPVKKKEEAILRQGAVVTDGAALARELQRVRAGEVDRDGMGIRPDPAGRGGGADPVSVSDAA